MEATDDHQGAARLPPGRPGATALLLTPGYLLGVTFSRGVRGTILSDKTFLANAVAGPWSCTPCCLSGPYRGAAHQPRRAARHARELTGGVREVRLLQALPEEYVSPGAWLAPLVRSRSPRDDRRRSRLAPRGCLIAAATRGRGARPAGGRAARRSPPPAAARSRPRGSSGCPPRLRAAPRTTSSPPATR